MQKAVDGAGFTIDPATGKVVTAAIRYHDALLKMGEDFTAKATCTNKKEDTDRTTYTYDVTIEGQGAYSGAYTRSGVTQVKTKEVAATSKAAASSDKKVANSKKAAGKVKTVAHKRGTSYSSSDWQIAWNDSLPKDSSGVPIFIYNNEKVEPGNALQGYGSSFTSVMLGGETLTLGTDYRLDWTGNTGAGTGKVIFILTPTYAMNHGITAVNGEKEFRIINSATIDCPMEISMGNGAQKYPVTFASGSTAGEPASGFVAEYLGSNHAVEPTIYVYQDSSKNVEYTSYSKVYSNNTSVGTGKVTITMQEQRANEVITINFPIVPQTLKESDVTITGTYTYTGSAQTPAVTVTSNGSTLSNGTDYTVSSTDINAGTATATITGKGNYKGSVNKTFTIGKATAADGTNVQIDVDDAVYDGTPKTPNVTVVDNLQGKTLVKGTDYSLSYSNNTAQGSTAAVTVIFNKNFTGSVTKNFTIGKGNITGKTVLIDKKAVASADYDPRYATAKERLSLEGVPSEGYDVAVAGKNGLHGQMQEPIRLPLPERVLSPEL